MNCPEVRKSLSAFMDDRLSDASNRAAAGHLESCAECRAELERLGRLRRALGSLERAEPPAYLRHMIQLRLEARERESLGARFRRFMEYRWSRIRTTEGLWFATRLLGTASTMVLFFVITAAMGPVYMEFPRQFPEQPATLTSVRQQLLAGHLLKNLGLLSPEEQMRPVRVHDPGINDLYFLQFGEGASRSSGEDSFSVLTRVDSSGSARIEGVLEYPADSALLSEFSSMIQSARCRPASQNGRAVNSHLILRFNRIEVNE